MSTKISLLSLYWVLLAVLLPVSPVFAQRPAVDFSRLEQVALDELKETNTPGAAVVVISGDRLVFAKGFGIANIETGTPLHLTRSFVSAR
jgi:CubicO group peptidase (beta-lactamase class C family)